MKEGGSDKFRGSRFPGGDKFDIDGKTYLFYIRLSASKQICVLWTTIKKKRVDQCKFSCSSLTRSDLCNMDGNQSHSMVVNSHILRSPEWFQAKFIFALVVPAEISDFCGFKPQILEKKGMTHTNS